MLAHVDPEKCQGHLRCVIFAPDVFEVDDYGNAHVQMGVIPVHLEDGTRQAAANCPERAISIDEGGGVASLALQQYWAFDQICSSEYRVGSSRCEPPGLTAIEQSGATPPRQKVRR